MASKKKRRTEIPQRRGGRPDYVPTPESRARVEHLVALGMSHLEISRLLINPHTGKGISVNTLAKHYRDELDRGSSVVLEAVAGSLMSKAISEDHPQAAISAMFMLKCRFGWRQSGERGDLKLPDLKTFDSCQEATKIVADALASGMISDGRASALMKAIDSARNGIIAQERLVSLDDMEDQAREFIRAIEGMEGSVEVDG